MCDAFPRNVVFVEARQVPLLAQSGRPFGLRVFTQDYPSEVQAIPIGANATHKNRGENCGVGF